MQCILPQTLTTPDKIIGNPIGNRAFCDPQQYKCALDRCTDGSDSLNIAQEINEDLLKILKKYSKAVREWSENSQKKVINSKESTTTKSAWCASIVAVGKHVDRNNAIATNIEQNVIKSMADFKSKNYGKNLLKIRKVKEFEKEFKRVQEPWLENINKIAEAKHAYHEARRKLDQAKELDDTANTDVGSSDEQKRKAKLTVDRRTKELDACKIKHQSLTTNVKAKQQKYEEDMFAILKKTDAFEKERLEHIQKTLQALKDSLTIETDTYQQSLQTEFTNAINLQNINKDIEDFDKKYGSQTKSRWPAFESLQD